MHPWYNPCLGTEKYYAISASTHSYIVFDDLLNHVRAEITMKHFFVFLQMLEATTVERNRCVVEATTMRHVRFSTRVLIDSLNNYRFFP